MSIESPVASLSALDGQRFSIVSAKAPLVRRDTLPQVMSFCEANRVEFLIARCPTFDLGAVQEMERLGFLLMDTLLYFSFDLRRKSVPQDLTCVIVREGGAGDGLKAKAVAGECFKGYTGHYHADPRLDKKKCDEVYEDWAYRACFSTGPRDGMLVSVSGEEVTGFGTMHMNDEKEGEGGLFCVSPRFRSRGVYQSIMIRCLNWCSERSLKRMIISTQVTNLASQKIWARLGFEPSHSFYTFHKWFGSSGRGGTHQP